MSGCWLYFKAVEQRTGRLEEVVRLAPLVKRLEAVSVHHGRQALAGADEHVAHQELGIAVQHLRNSAHARSDLETYIHIHTHTTCMLP